MEPIQRNQLLLFAVLSVLTSAVAYTSSQRELFSSSAERCNDQKVVCFISAANGNFNYGALQTGWCTHYILIDLIVVNSEAKLLIIEESIPALTLLTEVKGRIRQMGDQAKFILAIGGINQDSSHFSQAVEDLGRSQRLAESIVDYAHKYCFDGVDLAWFYPGSFGGCGADKTNLIVLLHKLRFLLQDTVSLSLTVGVDPQFEFRYNISLVNSYVDFVNIMSGDYHDPEQLSHVSPLYPGNANDRINVYSSVKAYVQAGLQLDKVVVLTSTYGYLYSLKAGRHREEDVVKSVQKLSNLCVRDILEQENFHTAWDHDRMVPYGMVTRDSTRKWITFNDLESHRKKAEFVQKNQLAGIGVFTLDQDIMDDCTGGVPFPFLFTLVKILRPNLAFRMLPKTLGVTGWQGVNQNYANSEDVLVKYIPNDDAPYVGFV